MLGAARGMVCRLRSRRLSSAVGRRLRDRNFSGYKAKEDKAYIAKLRASGESLLTRPIFMN